MHLLNGPLLKHHLAADNWLRVCLWAILSKSLILTCCCHLLFLYPILLSELKGHDINLTLHVPYVRLNLGL